MDPIMISLIIAVYFLPTIIAILRRNRIGSVLFVNLFIGWTFIGWLLAFIMAITWPRSPDVVHQTVYVTNYHQNQPD